MKTYNVVPGLPLIGVSDGRTLVSNIEGVDIAWGRLAGIGSVMLCRLLLRDVYGDDSMLQFIHRFKWHTVAGWDPTKPYSISEQDIRDVITQIKTDDADNAKIIARMARERPDVIINQDAEVHKK